MSYAANILPETFDTYTLPADGSIDGDGYLVITHAGATTSAATLKVAITGASGGLVGRIEGQIKTTSITGGYARIYYSYYDGVTLLARESRLTALIQRDGTKDWRRFVSPVLGVQTGATHVEVSCAVESASGTAYFRNIRFVYGVAALDIAVNAFQGKVTDGELEANARLVCNNPTDHMLGIDLQDGAAASVAEETILFAPGEIEADSSGTERLTANQQDCGDTLGVVTGFQMVGGGAGLYVISGAGRDGGKCILVEASGVKGEGCTLQTGYEAAIDPGLTYRWPFWLKAVEGFAGMTVYPEAIEKTSGGVEITRHYMDERYLTLPADWTEYYIEAEADATAGLWRCAIRIPDTNAKHFYIDDWSLKDVVPSVHEESADGQAIIDVSALDEGDYSIVPVVYDAATGEVVADSSIILNPIDQNWDVEVTSTVPDISFDKQGRLLLSGVPTMIRGVYDGSKDVAVPAALVGTGWNAVMAYNLETLSAENLAAYLAAVEAADVWLIVSLKDCDDDDEAITLVNGVKDCTKLLCYYIYDEPTLLQVEDDSLFDKVVAADPDHPVWTCLAYGQEFRYDYGQYRGVAHWVGIDCYPDFLAAKLSSTADYSLFPEFVTKAIDANLGSIPVWAVPEISRMYTSYPTAPTYTPPSLRAMKFCKAAAAIEGARSIVEFSYERIVDWGPDNQLRHAEQAIQWYAEYEDLCLADDADTQPVSDNSDVLAGARVSGDISWVLVANQTADEQTATVTWDGHTESVTLGPLGVQVFEYVEALASDHDIARVESTLDEIQDALSPVVTPAGVVSTYTSYAEMKDRLPDIDNMTIPTGSTINEWVTACIEYVGQEIDGRLEHLYETPFNPVPNLIRTIARYFAISMLLDPNFVGEVPAESRWSDTNRKYGEALLRRVESGELVLPTATQASGSLDLPQSTSSDRARDMTQAFYDADGDMLSEYLGTLDGI